MDPIYQNDFDKGAPGIRVFTSENIRFFPHIHTQIEIFYVLDGEVDVMVDGHTKRLTKNELCVVLSNNVHNFYTHSTNKHMTIIFEPEQIGAFSNAVYKKNLEYPFFDFNDIADEMDFVIGRLKKEIAGEPNKTAVMGYVTVILGRVLERARLYECSDMRGYALREAMNYIQENHGEAELSLTATAEAVEMSAGNLSRMFNSKIGMSFTEYVNKVRVNNAVKMLINTTESITKIAYECGFSCLRSFNRVFAKAQGMTPGEYRKRYTGKKQELFSEENCKFEAEN